MPNLQNIMTVGIHYKAVTTRIKTLEMYKDVLK